MSAAFLSEPAALAAAEDLSKAARIALALAWTDGERRDRDAVASRAAVAGATLLPALVAPGIIQPEEMVSGAGVAVTKLAGVKAVAFRRVMGTVAFEAGRGRPAIGPEGEREREAVV